MVRNNEGLCLRVTHVTYLYLFILHVGRTGPVVTAYGSPGDIKAFVAVVVKLLIFAYLFIYLLFSHFI
jgi:hypothetical protein